MRYRSEESLKHNVPYIIPHMATLPVPCRIFFTTQSLGFHEVKLLNILKKCVEVVLQYCARGKMKERAGIDLFNGVNV